MSCCLADYSSLCLYVNLSTILSVSMSIYLSVCLFICMSFYLFFCLSFYLSICPSVYSSIFLCGILLFLFLMLILVRLDLSRRVRKEIAHPLVVGGSILSPNCFIAKDVKSSMWRLPGLKVGSNHYHAHLGLPD